MTTNFLSEAEAALNLNISPRTLQKFRVTGRGPIFRKFGRRVLYDAQDLAAWADQAKRRSTSDRGAQG